MAVSLSLLIVVASVVWSRIKGKCGRQLRRSVLEAALLTGAGTIVCTELLGLLHAVRPGWIGLTWFAAGAMGLVYLWCERHAFPPFLERLVRRSRTVVLPSIGRYWRPLELITLAVVLGATGVIAWLAPPTNFDSMTYQLPRVMHWLQQGSLEHYPTSNIRQLAYGPGASYWQVQLWALFGGDRAANLPQWGAFLGCAVALSLWLQRLFDRRAIALAIVAGLTLPMALLQASSAQTDLQVGCWLLVAAVCFTNPAPSKLSCAGFAGLAIGLAVITKSSAALYAIPMACLQLWRLWASYGPVTAIRAGLIWTGGALMVCLPHFLRNLRWFGNALGDDFGTVVESASPTLALANLVRWLTLNVPSMSIWRGIAQVLELVGIDPNDPAITFRDYKFSPASPYVVYRLLLPDEDFVAYAATLLLVVVLALGARRTRSPLYISRPPLESRAQWLAVLAAMLLLQCIFLKWQFWGNRLLLPWALFACPFLMAWTGAWQRRRLRIFVTGLLLIQAIFTLSCSLNRPLVNLPASWRYTGAIPLFSASRTTHFFAGYNSETAQVADQIVAAVRERQWRRIGLLVDENYPEYALWRALHEAGYGSVELHHLNAMPPAHVKLPWPPAVDGHIVLSSIGNPGAAKP